jgi:hypothetical protein
VAGYQEKLLKTQFKKAYSVYSQNLQKTVMIDLDGDSRCYYFDDRNSDVSGCTDFYDKFTENMNVVKTCKGNAFSGGCIPKYDDYLPTVSGCSGYRINEVNFQNTAYVMNDGSIMMPYYINTGALFLFDVNGMKGPNKPGYDLFSIEMLNKDGVIKFGSTSILDCLNTISDAPFKKLDDVMN